MARPDFGIFGGSRWVRWTIIPVALASAVVYPWVWIKRGQASDLPLVLGLEILIALLVAGVASPQKYRWAGRCFGAGVFVLFAGILVSEMLGGRFQVGQVFRSVPKPSERAIVMDLVFFGIPGLYYAVRGRSPFRKRASRATG